MKKYEVTITETLQKTISVNANSRAEAEEIAEVRWNNSEYILSADVFVEARFDAKECVRSKDYER